MVDQLRAVRAVEAGEVVSRPLEGEAPTIDIAVGYSKSNTSPVLELFVSRLDQLVRLNDSH